MFNTLLVKKTCLSKHAVLFCWNHIFDFVNLMITAKPVSIPLFQAMSFSLSNKFTTLDYCQQCQQYFPTSWGRAGCSDLTKRIYYQSL